MSRVQIAITPSNHELEQNMKIMKLSVAVMATGLFLATAPAFAQTAQKQPTQSEGGGATPCNMVANPSADPDCARFKQRTQSLTPSPAQGVQESTGQRP